MADQTENAYQKQASLSVGGRKSKQYKMKGGVSGLGLVHPVFLDGPPSSFLSCLAPKSGKIFCPEPRGENCGPLPVLLERGCAAAEGRVQVMPILVHRVWPRGLVDAALQRLRRRPQHPVRQRERNARVLRKSDAAIRAGARNRNQPGIGGQSRGRRLGGRTWYSVVWSRLHSDADSSAVFMI